MFSYFLSPFLLLNVNYDAINEVEDVINKNAVRIPSSSDANEMILKGMMISVDRYSNYFTPEENEEFSKNKTGKFIGIGVKISQTKSGFPVVNDVIKDSPASLVGIKKNDIILKIDDESIKNDYLMAISKKIQGRAGTFVTLDIKRNGKIHEFRIERREIVNKSIYYSLKDGILIIRIKSFSEDVYSDFLKVFDKIEADSFSSVLIDLRDNPGGLLEAAVKIANLFMKKGVKITELVDKDGNILQSYYSTGSEKEYLLNKKISVLINRNSASASEVLVGCFLDNKIATIYGEKSFGKAAVQEMINLKSIEGASVKITIAKYLTPAGTDITDTGIEPNIKIDPKQEDEVLRMIKEM